MAHGKDYQSQKKASYYQRQFIRTAKNKQAAKHRIFRRKLEIPHVKGKL